jgi:hypothetical protein
MCGTREYASIHCELPDFNDCTKYTRDPKLSELCPYYAGTEERSCGPCPSFCRNCQYNFWIKQETVSVPFVEKCGDPNCKFCSDIDTGD